MLEFERQCWAAGYTRVAGVDEAGRGPLAGPVAAAAVVFEREFLEAEQHGALDGLTDSKQMTERQREHFFAILVSSPCVFVGVGFAENEEIDRINILNATHEAMRRALVALSPPPTYALVDGWPVPGLPCPSTAIVKGDARSLSVAAASVVAKVRRDEIMREMGRVHPGYGFERHKGYGTREHVKALLELGPTPIHRRSFQPVEDAVRIRSGESIDFAAEASRAREERRAAGARANGARATVAGDAT